MPSISRRLFLAGCAGAGVAAFLPQVTAGWDDALLAAKDRPLWPGAGILVIITMYGGNDGLNTVIPYTSNAYYEARPELAYDPDDVLRLDDEYGLNPGMPGLQKMFEGGSMAVVRGVGYPEPDRSHFRSMDIWQSAVVKGSTDTGWIGRWLDATDADPLKALHLGPVLPALAVGKTRSATSFSNQIMSARDTKLVLALSKSSPDDTATMSIVCDSYRDSVGAQSQLAPMYNEEGVPRIELGHALESQLAVVAECILAGVPTRVYSVSIGGFDTHAEERGDHQKLLEKLDVGLTRFFERVAGGPRANDIVVIAYSEFGRRVKANASDGTDHGTAGPVFVIGDRVEGGFYGEEPSLTDLTHDDLKVTTDFRDVYHEILSRGLGADPEPVIGGKRKDIGFLKG